MIDGLGPDGVAATSRFFSRMLRRVQTGFVYHYSFVMLIAAVAFGAYAIYAGMGMGGRAMSEMFAGWPILSIITFLPAAGAVLILLSRMSLRGVNSGYDNGVRLLTLIITIATFLVSLVAFAAFDFTNPGLPVRRIRAVGVRRGLPDGRRLALDVARSADDVPDAALHSRQLVDREAGLQLHGAVPDCSRR